MPTIRIGIVYGGNSGAFQDYNLFAGVATPTSGVVLGGEHSLTATDAHFAGLANDDYQLTPASDAFDTGVDDGVTVDFDDVVRPQGATWDMGAYELTGVTALTVTKHVSSGHGRPAAPVTYTVVFTNAGVELATGVLITDIVPARFSGLAWSSSGAAIALTQLSPAYAWQVQDLSPGASGIITVSGVMTDYQVPGDIFTNTVTFAAANARTRTSSAVLTVDCPPVYTTNTTADSGTGSLRQGIAHICPGGTIDFDALVFGTPQTVTLTSDQLTLDKSLTIDGAANSVGTPTLSGPGAGCITCFRVISVTAGITVTLDRLNITNGNEPAAAGGGIYNHGVLVVQNTRVYGNYAAKDGGGLFNHADTVDLATMTLIGTKVYSNVAKAGGGIYNDAGTLAVTNSTLAANSATTHGGAVENHGTLAVTNSTFTANTAVTSASSIFNSSGSTATIVNSTFSGTGAGAFYATAPPVTGRSIYNNANASLSFSNTIVANTTSGADCYSDPGASLTSFNNLVEDGSCNAALRGDPLLNVLQNNGGSTWTMALLPGSPAIDAGVSCTESDQRGVPRPQGGACRHWSVRVARLYAREGRRRQPRDSQPTAFRSTALGHRHQPDLGRRAGTG